MMLEEFAASRRATLANYDDELMPVVRRALAEYKSGRAWYAPIVDKARELGGDDFSAAEAKVLRDTLRKTKDPATTGGDTAQRLTAWVSTYVVNATEHASADEDSNKTWVTMHDDRVREVHMALEGKTIAAADKFDVGGARLSFPGEPVGDPAVWINCRCVLQVTKGNEMSLIADVGPKKDDENEIPKADPADLPAENPDEDKIDDAVEVPFHGVATVTDRPTGDRRQLARDGFSVRPLPLPLFYQRAQSEGHGGSTIVGKFTRMDINEAGEVEYDGVFNFTPEAQEAIQGVAEQWLRGVSVDLDDVLVDYSKMDMPEPDEEDTRPVSEIMDEMQAEVTVFKQWRVAGLTMVGIPAFHEGYIALGPRGSDLAPTDPVEKDDAALAASAAFAPGTHDGPGWITAPVPTARIRRYWTHGEGAAKIKWGVPGDFNRCRTQLAKYIVNQDWLAGACANMHKEATGGWPGHAPTEGASIVEQGALVASAFNLVAAAPPRDVPPAAWFQNPGLEGPTPITIEGDHVFGHIATWGVCHIGLPGTCTEAPRSATDYSWFRLGAVQTDDGLIPVGQITMDTGHADLRASQRSAAAHYDNTGAAVADIATGEDDWGIWFSGRIRPSATADQRDALLAAKLSGDWREVQGNLELVAALAVNTPGFGIPRLALAASGQVQNSLIAAGIVGEAEPVKELSLEEKIERGVLQVLHRRERLAALPETTARLRALAAQRRHDRVNAAKQRFGR